MFGESFVVESRRVRSAMCGGSIRCDNVLPGQGYRISQEAMTDECGVMAKRRLAG
jgi:hypothetical protein